MLALLCLSPGLAQPIPPSRQYLDQAVPGAVPKVFNLATTPGFFAAERICLSPDGRELYFSELNGYNPSSTGRLKVYRFEGDRWTGPHPVLEGFSAPAWSGTPGRLWVEKDFRMFESERAAGGWSEPKILLSDAHYAMTCQNGRTFVSSAQAEGRIGPYDWSEVIREGKGTIIRSLGRPLNQPGKNLDFFIARDASYLILARATEQLQISFPKADGSWTHPKPLVGLTGYQTWGPYVTDDGKYLFFSGGTSESNTHTYWIRIDEAIARERLSNFPPYVQTRPVPQTAFAGKPFRFQLPPSAFRDDDGDQTVSLSATLKTGEPLPPWLSFDPASRILAGSPPTAGITTVRITATDSAKATASLDLEIRTDITEPVKPVVSQPSDIPDHAYTIPGKPSQIVQDAQAMISLSLQIEKALESDFQTYDIQDQASLASLHSTLYQTAAMRKDHAAVLRHLAELKARVAHPVRRATVGLLVEPCLEAIAQPSADFHASYRRLLALRLSALPNDARVALPALIQSLKSMTPSQLTELIASRVDPGVKDGRLTEELAGALLSTALNFHLLLPMKDDAMAVLSAYLEASAQAK